MSWAVVLRYELLNIARNRWVVFYGLLLALLSVGVLRISGDPAKSVVTLATVLVVLVPLVATVFTSLYWYYNERFTELLLTQPVPRETILWMRWLALSGALAAGMAAGLAAGFAVMRAMDGGFFLLIGVAALLTVVFVGTTLFFCARNTDRMKGVGLGLGAWFYFVTIHDGITLFSLIALRDYPMDVPGGILGAVNPIGLARVVLLRFLDAPLLLGHTGALARNILGGGTGVAIGVAVSLFWIAAPLVGATLRWRRRDF